MMSIEYVAYSGKTEKFRIKKDTKNKGISKSLAYSFYASERPVVNKEKKKQ